MTFMKTRNLTILVAVLAVLIVIYIIQQLSPGKKSVSESLIEIFPDFNSSSVSQIKVYKQDYPDSGLSFAKKDGIWLVASYFNAPAKENDIDKLLTDINTLQGEIRSVNADLHDDFEIADNTALHLEFSGPDSTIFARLLIGKGVPQASRSSFIRKYNTDTVYKANENFLSRFAVWNAEPAKKMPAKRWADMKMTDADKNTVSAIEIKAKRMTYSFEKVEEPAEDTTLPPKSVWKQIKPKKGEILKDKDIQTILNRLTKLNANEIVGNEILSEHGLTKPKYSAGFTTEDGQSTKINFGAVADTTSEARYANVEGKPFVYKAAKYNYESIFVNPFKKD